MWSWNKVANYTTTCKLHFMIIERIIVTFSGKHICHTFKVICFHKKYNIETIFVRHQLFSGNERISDFWMTLLRHKISYFEKKQTFLLIIFVLEVMAFKICSYWKTLACNTVESCGISYWPQAMHGTRTAILHGIQPRAVLE